MADEPNLNGLAGSRNSSAGAGQTAQKYARDMLANYWRPAVQASAQIRSNMEAAARAMQAATGAAGKVNLSSFDVADGFSGSRVMGRPTFSTNSAGVSTPLSQSTAVARFSGGGALARRPSGLGLASFSTPANAPMAGFMGAAFGGQQRALPAGYAGWRTSVQPYSGGGAVEPYSGGGGQIMPFGNQGGDGGGGSGLPLPRGGYNWGKVGMGLAAGGAALAMGGPKNQDTYTRDLLAQTLVQTGGSGTSAKQFRTQYGNMSGSFSVSDMAQAYGGIANMGFGAGTKGFDYNSGLVSQLANQSGMGGAASQAMYANLMGGQTTNRMRAMLGVNTMNSDGSVKNINSLAKSIMGKLGGGGLSLTDLNKSLAPGRSMDFDLNQLGLDDNTKQQLIASMRAQAVGGAGLDSLNPGRATVAALANENQKQKNDALTQDSRSATVSDFQNAVKDFHGFVQDLYDWIPGLKTVVGDTQGIKSSLGGGGGGHGGGIGGALTSILGARAVMKVAPGLVSGAVRVGGSVLSKGGSLLKGVGKGIGGGADALFGWFPSSVGGADPFGVRARNNGTDMGLGPLGGGGGPEFHGTDGAGAGGGAAGGVPSGPSGTSAVDIARKYLGVPYKWGGNDANGFDCSGLVKAVYAQLGINLPRTAAAQAHAGSPVPSLSAAIPGDLLFWGQPAHHVAIYIGNGMMIAAPHKGTDVRVQRVYGNPYVRRVLGNTSTLGGKNSNVLSGAGSVGGQSNNSIGGGSSSMGALGNAGMSTSSTGVTGNSMSAGDMIAAALSGSSYVGGGGGGGSTGNTAGGSTMPGTSNGGGAPAAPGNLAGNKALAQKMAAAMGWGKGAEWNALYALWQQESGFSNTAGSPAHAYGIAQFMPGTWKDMGASVTNDPAAQIRLGLKYIQGRYGDPIGAENHKHATDSRLGSHAQYAQPGGWYAQGAYEVQRDQDARVHSGEMILPAHEAEQVRSGMRKGSRGGGTVINNFYVQQMSEAEITRVITRIQSAMGDNDIISVLRGS